MWVFSEACPLHSACHRGNLAIVKELVAHNAHVNERGGVERLFNQMMNDAKYGLRSPLFIAAQAGEGRLSLLLFVSSSLLSIVLVCSN